MSSAGTGFVPCTADIAVGGKCPLKCWVSAVLSEEPAGLHTRRWGSAILESLVAPHLRLDLYIGIIMSKWYWSAGQTKIESRFAERGQFLQPSQENELYSLVIWNNVAVPAGENVHFGVKQRSLFGFPNARLPLLASQSRSNKPSFGKHITEPRDTDS